MACYEQHNEDFKRGRLDAGGVYDWLIEKIINELCEAEYGYDYGRKPDEAHVQADRYSAAVFYHKCQNCSESSSQKRTDIWYDVQYACEEGDSDGCVESQSCYKEQT